MPTRRAVVYFDSQQEEALARAALGKDARYFAGLAEGELESKQFHTLLDAGLTVEVVHTDGPGNQPTPESVLARALNLSADDLGGAETGAAPGPADGSEPRAARATRALPAQAARPAAFPLLLRGMVSGLIFSVGILIVLQQLGVVDPTIASAARALISGLVISLLLTALSLLRR